MYYFKVKVSGETNLHEDQGLVDSKNFKEALNDLLEWYDEDELITLELSPVDSIVFNDDMKYIFPEDNDEKSN